MASRSARRAVYLLFVGKWSIAHPQALHRNQDSVGEVGSKDLAVAELEFRDHDPLPWLFSKLSFQVRSAHIVRQNTATTEVSVGCPL